MAHTSEYVSLGHPDKIADYISEYILDQIIKQDQHARYALEIQIKDNHITYGGEITTTADLKPINHWIKQAVEHIGYTHKYATCWDKGDTLDADDLDITGHISVQSPDIAQGVDKDAWGDQGVFFGFCSEETPDGDGIDHYLAKLLGQSLYYMAKEQPVILFGLDIKTQITVDCIKNGTAYISEVVVAIPMKCSTFAGRHFIRKVVDDFIKQQNCRKAKGYTCIVNGTGAYKRHASMGDCGTTGRKLVVDFHGGRSRIGGGSPWTKDGSKADLTLNLYANYLSRVYMERTRREFGGRLYYVETELSCCIGKSHIRGTITGYDKNYNRLIILTIEADPKPSALIKHFQLDTPRFADLCEFGLFTPPQND